MKALFATVASAAALFAAAPALADDHSYDARLMAESDAAFAELVENRVAGEPRRCIVTFNDNALRVVENVGLAYRRGDTLWVARARNPRNLDGWDVPVIERYGSRLCTNDVMRTIDRNSGMFSGVLFLDDFVPYREAEG